MEDGPHGVDMEHAVGNAVEELKRGQGHVPTLDPNMGAMAALGRILTVGAVTEIHVHQARILSMHAWLNIIMFQLIIMSKHSILQM